MTPPVQDTEDQMVLANDHNTNDFDEEEIVSVPPDIADTCMNTWVCRTIDGRPYSGQIRAIFKGLRSQEIFYEIHWTGVDHQEQHTDGRLEHLTRDQVLRYAELYRNHEQDLEDHGFLTS